MEFRRVLFRSGTAKGGLNAGCRTSGPAPMRTAIRFILIVMLLGITPGFARGDIIDAEWGKYRDRFVTDQGRVIDTRNRGISHTEGQGWGMLFAETAGDRVSFDRIWNWTQSKLQRRDTALFAWRWDPAGGNTAVAD